MTAKWLLTGVPGVGKTTLVQRVLDKLDGVHVSGFTSAELRGAHGRTGFKVVTLAGREGQLATTRPSTGGPRVGRYSVDLPAFERVALPTLALRPGVELYVIDEIGKMESFSAPFVQAVRTLLSSDVPVLATVALRGGGIIAEVKSTPGSELIEVTRENRDELVGELATRIRIALTR